MQVKTTTGAMVEIADCQIQRLLQQMHQDRKHWLDPDKACKANKQYMQKASHNLKRLSCMQDDPQTQDDAKDAVHRVLLYGSPKQLTDAIGQLAQFQAARVVHNMLKHALTQE